jgi:protein TonB
MATQDHGGLRTHLSGSVPASIVVHLVLLLVLVIIPLASDIVAPIPAIMMPSYVLAAPLPPPPAVVPRPATAPALRPATGVAPTRAPDRITAEPESPQPFAPLGADIGVPQGFGADLGGVSIDAPLPPPIPVAVARPLVPVRAAELPVLPRKVVDVHPVYPEVARAARVEGTVILEAVLDTSGRVTQLRVLRSVPLLDQAALDAVRQWHYSPSVYYGRPVSVLMTITVRFTLQQ